MLIGYARVSKADGSQSLDLQRDALIEAGVEKGQIYSDLASGIKDCSATALIGNSGRGRSRNCFHITQFSNRGYSPYFRYNLSLICLRLYRKFGTYLRFKN